MFLQMDNTTAVAYVNKRGGTRSRSLSLQATDLWAVVLKASSWVTAKHIPGTSNDVADTASRHFDSHLELPTGRLCYASQQPTSAVCLSISGPRGNNNGCLSLRLESVEKLDLSTIGPDPENSEQDSNGQSNSFDTSSTLEGTVLVSQSAGNVGGLSETASTTTGIDNAPLRTRDRTSAPTQTTPNRVACIRERLHTG